MYGTNYSKCVFNLFYLILKRKLLFIFLIYLYINIRDRPKNKNDNKTDKTKVKEKKIKQIKNQKYSTIIKKRKRVIYR